jgi:DNA-binding NtrC family response regulator
MVFFNWEEIIDDLNLNSRTVATSRSDEQILEGSSIVDVFLDFKSEYSSDNESFSLKKITKKATDSIEKEVISSALDLTDWNRVKASKILNISYRTILYKISDLDIKMQNKPRSLKFARLLMSF